MKLIILFLSIAIFFACRKHPTGWPCAVPDIKINSISDANPWTHPGHKIVWVTAPFEGNLVLRCPNRNDTFLLRFNNIFLTDKATVPPECGLEFQYLGCDRAILQYPFYINNQLVKMHVKRCASFLFLQAYLLQPAVNAILATAENESCGKHTKEKYVRIHSFLEEKEGNNKDKECNCRNKPGFEAKVNTESDYKLNYPHSKHPQRRADSDNLCKIILTYDCGRNMRVQHLFIERKKNKRSADTNP